MITKLKRKIERKILQRLLPNDFYFSKRGYCPCCQQEVEFLSYDPWLRDYFCCVECGSIPRNRALIHVLEKHFPAWRVKDIHESSPSTGGASARIRRDCPKYIASQYYSSRAPGEMIDGHRNENLESMSFEDASFDLVVTQDVLEHVYEPAKVFQEIARTLRPGGAHIFGVPIINKHRASQVWALKGQDGEPKFMHEPEYHGNPIDRRGSPVTMHWGFDIVQFIQDACGLQTTIEYVDDLQFGIRGEYIEVLVTKKPFA